MVRKASCMFTLFFSSLGSSGSYKSRKPFPKLSQNTKPQFTTTAESFPYSDPQALARERVLMARKENSVNAVRSNIHRRSNPEIPSRPPPPSQNYSGGMRDERGARLKTMEVELVRDYQEYGFSIRGGRELNLPIFVLRMAEGGVAERDGRLGISEEVQNKSFVQSHIFICIASIVIS